MPELPEVEATRRHLVSQGLVGRTITGVELLWAGAARGLSAEAFTSDVSGRRIRDVRRRGKYLILALTGRPGRALVLHLRMTGSLLVQAHGAERPTYTRNVLLLDGGLELRFVDPRKLGTMRLVSDEAEVLAGLGPEPLDPEFTPEGLAGRLSGRTAPVKALLCDQAFVAGIGNLYADEVLFLACIYPLTPGGGLSLEDARRLHEAIVERLSEATQALVPWYAQRGQPDYGGSRPELLLLPRKEGAECTHCGEPVRRIIVRGRSSYFCPRRQGDPRSNSPSPSGGEDESSPATGGGCVL